MGVDARICRRSFGTCHSPRLPESPGHPIERPRPRTSIPGFVARWSPTGRFLPNRGDQVAALSHRASLKHPARRTTGAETVLSHRFGRPDVLRTW